MVPNAACTTLDLASAIWLVNAAVEAGHEDLVSELVAEVEDENNQRHVMGAASQDR